MINIAEIEHNPDWVPHGLNLNTKTVEFLRIPSAQLALPGFLAEFNPEHIEDRTFIAFDDVLSMAPPRGSLHFIFHTAFCRSTLLTRALNIPSVSDGLNEPGIFAALTNAGEDAGPLIRPILRLLARPRGSQHVVFVKPTNHSNRLIPTLLKAAPNAKAILITNDVPYFLESVQRRGLLGRNWVRKLYLELQAYAGIDFQMDARETYLLTDMQSGALAWLLNQNFFHLVASSALGNRIRVVDGEWFNKHRAETLEAILEFVGIALSQEDALQAANGPAFATHSKLGGEYADKSLSVTREKGPTQSEEIQQVQRWLKEIEAQLPIIAPVRQSLA
ncbi:hypothetical protein ACIGGE_08910 [Qipengyuania sp. NPDC077410]|uniref:hypothetical protein n=1 Tax=Qipengyuania sp. NPDC077410 TaxID=3364496 RepID=UPI0037C60F04